MGDFDQNAQIREGPRREGQIRAGFGLEMRSALGWANGK